MKLNIKISLCAIVLAAVALMSVSCEKGDSIKDVGYAKVYIPQATVTGLDNSYPIPLGPFGQNTTYSCNYENGILNIALGVVRSGYLNDQKAFSVSVAVDAAETNEKVANLGSAVAIPSGAYTLPDKVQVESGKNTGTFYMGVNLRQLSSSAATLKDGGSWKKLVLSVRISNPTEYELADANTSVVVVVDLNSEYWDAEGAPAEVRTLFPLVD